MGPVFLCIVVREYINGVGAMSHMLRVQRQRTPGWRKPVAAVSVTRPGVFGNPFHTAVAFEEWLVHGWISTDKIKCRSYFPWDADAVERLRVKRQTILDRLPDLRGKQVMCFCGLDQACHGDVLARLANDGVVE